MAVKKRNLTGRISQVCCGRSLYLEGLCTHPGSYHLPQLEAVNRQSRRQRGGDLQPPTDVSAPVMISQREEWEHKEDKSEHIGDLHRYTHHGVEKKNEIKTLFRRNTGLRLMEKQENRMMAVKTKDSVNGAMEVIRAILFFTIQSSSPTTSLLPLVPGEVFTEYILQMKDLVIQAGEFKH